MLLTTKNNKNILQVWLEDRKRPELLQAEEE